MGGRTIPVEADVHVEFVYAAFLAIAQHPEGHNCVERRVIGKSINKLLKDFGESDTTGNVLTVNEQDTVFYIKGKHVLLTR